MVHPYKKPKHGPAGKPADDGWCTSTKWRIATCIVFVVNLVVISMWMDPELLTRAKADGARAILDGRAVKQSDIDTMMDTSRMTWDETTKLRKLVGELQSEVKMLKKRVAAIESTAHDHPAGGGAPATAAAAPAARPQKAAAPAGEPGADPVTVHDASHENIVMAPGFDLSAPSPGGTKHGWNPTAKERKKADSRRGSLYRGFGDPAHLGGFSDNSTDSQAPMLWLWMMKHLTVKSVIDIGCGRGYSTKWFLDHGARVLCVEGSHDAVTNSFLPPQLIVEHDFSKGPYWSEETFDLAWSIEFLEHVGRHYMLNYIPTFKRAALIYLSHSYWGGYHHVEVHGDWWWKNKMRMYGFVYSDELTRRCRAIARGKADGFRSQHVYYSGMVFINPAVASLPKHAHVIGGPGCCCTKSKRKRFECKKADKVPEAFMHILKPDMYDPAFEKADEDVFQMKNIMHVNPENLWGGGQTGRMKYEPVGM